MKNVSLCVERGLRIAVDQENSELILRFQRKIGCRIAGKAVFLEPYFACVGAGLSGTCLKRNSRLAFSGIEASFCSFVWPSIDS